MKLGQVWSNENNAAVENAETGQPIPETPQVEEAGTGAREELPGETAERVEEVSSLVPLDVLFLTMMREDQVSASPELGVPGLYLETSRGAAEEPATRRETWPTALAVLLLAGGLLALHPTRKGAPSAEDKQPEVFRR